MRVGIAGTGMVGLTTGIALKNIGAEVVLLEQAPKVRAVGASIGIWENALQVFDELGVGQQVRSKAITLETWFYDAAGNRFRDPVYGREEHTFSLLPRPVLNDVLADAVGFKNIRFDSKVVGYEETGHSVRVDLANGTSDEFDLLIGADGVYSQVRNQLAPGYPARKHVGHYAWRGMVATQGEPAQGSVLTVGHQRTRGGFTRAYGDQVMWMVNQFESPEPTATKKEEALKRAAIMNDNGWSEPLLALIEATPEEKILFNQIMFVPELPRWSSARVCLIGDAAHGLSPHISAGGTLGIEDVRVLTRFVQKMSTLEGALTAYEQNRIPHYREVNAFAANVEAAVDAQDYAYQQAVFAHWMLHEGNAHSWV
jgi:salicylate hydroxylase